MNINQSLFQILKNDDFSFIYLGKFDNIVLGITTELLKNYMTQNEDSEGKKNKLSFLLIESFQNILRYGLAGRGSENKNGEIFIVRNIEGCYYITTGNFIENSKIETITSKLEKVNSLNQDELKQMFVATLTNKQLSKEGGAGLGFVEMIRKTKEKLEYHFTKINDERSFFYFQLKLKKSELEAPTVDILEAKQIKELMENNNRFIAIKGDFNRATVNQLLSVAENNIIEQTSELKTQRKVYHIMVEMVQNIAKHALTDNNNRHNGLFSIGNYLNKYILSASNIIAENDLEQLKKYIEKLNSKTVDELNEYYKHILRNGHQDINMSSGLGLIDIARDSSIKINDLYSKIENNSNLFTIECEI
ncbi:MAG: SiaB family protein kinase [Bacteroidales bacterium]|nr:SiaB family protein kinase [Bacteroidales bacterium]